jgi:hypothetical protein
VEIAFESLSPVLRSWSFAALAALFRAPSVRSTSGLAMATLAAQMLGRRAHELVFASLLVAICAVGHIDLVRFGSVCVCVCVCVWVCMCQCMGGWVAGCVYVGWVGMFLCVVVCFGLSFLCCLYVLVVCVIPISYSSAISSFLRSAHSRASSVSFAV